MSYPLDYDEPIPKVVERLKQEHKELESKLSQIQQAVKDGKPKVAMSLLNSISSQLLRHAVEEEARLMRVIMWEFKKESEQSISVMRYHREISDFLKHKLQKLSQLPDAVALREVQIFINDVRKHHAEEEKVAFPLALKADELHEKRTKSTITAKARPS
jgi:SMC interacting uncharacterized protein involved in chromosome segregation